jgi:acyl-CoA synthetase (AMP-forming)/AMP-acid ligase II
VSDEVLAETCREHLVAYKVPAAYHRIESLPRNEVGKVLRRALLDSLEQPGDQ